MEQYYRTFHPVFKFISVIVITCFLATTLHIEQALAKEDSLQRALVSSSMAAGEDTDAKSNGRLYVNPIAQHTEDKKNGPGASSMGGFMFMLFNPYIAWLLAYDYAPKESYTREGAQSTAIALFVMALFIIIVPLIFIIIGLCQYLANKFSIKHRLMDAIISSSNELSMLFTNFINMVHINIAKFIYNKHLIKRLENPQLSIREQASNVLEKAGLLTDALKIKKYLYDLNDRDASMRIKAITGLADLEYDGIADILMSKLTDADLSVRQAVTTILKKLGLFNDTNKIKRYIADLKDNKASIRFSAVRELDKLGNRYGIEYLIQNMEDPNSTIYKVISGTINKSIEGLIKNLKSNSELLRQSAIASGEQLYKLANRFAVSMSELADLKARLYKLSPTENYVVDQDYVRTGPYGEGYSVDVYETRDNAEYFETQKEIENIEKAIPIIKNQMIQIIEDNDKIANGASGDYAVKGSEVSFSQTSTHATTQAKLPDSAVKSTPPQSVGSITRSTNSETDWSQAYLDYNNTTTQQEKDMQSYSKAPAELNIQLAEKAISERKITYDEIKDEDLKAFFQLLKDNGLEDIVVMGGAVRDVFFGKAVHDIDITIKVELTPEEQRDFARTTSQATERVYNHAMDQLDKLAKVLGVAREDFLRTFDDPNVPRFRGLEVGYQGSRKAVSEKGTHIFAKGFLFDSKTRQCYLALTGPSLLKMGIDCDGNLYGYNDALNDALQGKISIVGDGNNYPITNPLRILRLKHQFGLEISLQDYQVMKKVIENYPQTEKSLSGILSCPFEQQINVVLTTAKDRQAAQKELEDLGLISLLSEARALKALKGSEPLSPQTETPVAAAQDGVVDAATAHPTVPAIAAGQQSYSEVLKSQWQERMRALEDAKVAGGFDRAIAQLDELENSRRVINGIEYFRSDVHETVMTQKPWHEASRVSFDQKGFDLSSALTRKPQEVVKPVSLNGRPWYIALPLDPRLKYHMLVVPQGYRPQLATADDLRDLQRLLGMIKDENAAIYHSSLMGGADLNSLHFHLVFHKMPVFENESLVYPGVGEFNSQVFKGINYIKRSGDYLKELQLAQQPYDVLMRKGEIIVVVRPNDLEFPYGGLDMGGVILYGKDKDKTLDEAVERYERSFNSAIAVNMTQTSIADLVTSVTASESIIPNLTPEAIDCGL